MKTYTEGDMFRAWTEGWHAGFRDHRSLATELTPNPYAQKSGLETPAKKSLQTAETEPLAEETITHDPTRRDLGR